MSRGVAALSVVWYHYNLSIEGIGLRFGYLAVDLFFLISGFVLARRYDPDFRNGLTTAAFCWQRIKRLAPLYVLGIAIGLVNQLTRTDYHWNAGRLTAATRRT